MDLLTPENLPEKVRPPVQSVKASPTVRVSVETTVLCITTNEYNVFVSYSWCDVEMDITDMI